jgi:hypothetical protein
MNLERHLNVLWRHRAVALGGVLLGALLAFLAAYDLPSLDRRGSESWAVESHILVTQSGFPEGRITLSNTPSASPDAGAPSRGSTGPSGGGQSFADPLRLSSLALLYSVIADSDRVRSKLPGDPRRGQIEAIALDATGNGTTFLPIMQLTTTAGSADAAQRLNVASYEAFKAELESEQQANAIPQRDRIRLSVLNRPSNPLMVSGPTFTPSILAFLLCCLGGLAAAHILEALSLRRAAAESVGDPVVFPPAAAGAEPVPEPAQFAPAGRSGRLRR